MKSKLKLILLILAGLVFIVAVFFLGAYLGHNDRPAIEKILSVINKEPKVETQADFGPFWEAWKILEDKSIYRGEVTDQDMVWGAIQGLASSMKDPYTVFFPPEESKEFEEEIEGSFEGIGAEIAVKDGILTIVAPLKDTPAWKAGLKAGDRILKIDNTTTENMSSDKAVGLMRGPKGSAVILTILSKDEVKEKEVSVIRDVIEYPVIETEKLDNGIFIIHFYSFSQNSLSMFKKALIEFMEAKTDKLIIDLRGNPGGYLSTAISIGSIFIEEGKTIVSEDFDGKADPKTHRSRGPNIFDKNLKMVVLIDGGSASASEILAGALQQYKVATLVGEKTFGKGTVQELVKLTDNTSLKITIAKWLLPDGKPIPEDGLAPDVVVSVSEKDITQDNDPQMDKAVEILSQGESR